MIHCKRQILGQAYKSQDLVYYAELLLTVLANNYNAYRSFVLGGYNAYKDGPPNLYLLNNYHMDYRYRHITPNVYL